MAQQLVYAPSLRENVLIGSFVMFYTHENGSAENLGRLVATRTIGTVEYIEVKVFSTDDANAATETLQTRFLRPSTIVELGLIVSPAMLEGHFISIAGVSNFFSIGDARYFAGQSDSSMSIVSDTGNIQRMFRKALNSASEKQGDKDSFNGNLQISLMTWRYIKRTIATAVGTLDARTKWRVGGAVLPRMNVSSKRFEVSSEVATFETTDEMNALEEVVGSFQLVGVRRKRPAMRRGVVKLSANDAIHYIPETVEKNGMPSVRFEFVDLMNTLFLKIEYEKYAVKFDNTTGLLCDTPSTRITTCERYDYAVYSAEEEELGLEIGDEFESDDVEWIVRSICLLTNVVIAHQKSNPELESEFQVEPVKALVAARYDM